MSALLVVAFGGNAIHPSSGRGTLEEQHREVRRMAAELAQLLIDGHRVVVTHGNGPQVGELMLRSELLQDVVPPFSLDVAGAMTQGQIGYLLQQEIENCARSSGRPAGVCTVVTQVVVDALDPAFLMPTKPIGRFYSKQEADTLIDERQWQMIEDAGRGYRRVVPSPMPIEIVESGAIKTLVDAGMVVVAGGGGGVPVVRGPDGSLRGVEAVIDKDLASQCLANHLGATTLVLLTEVEAVSINYGSPRQKRLGLVSLDEVASYAAQGQFAPGSMGPKMQAALQFLRRGGRRVIVTSSRGLVQAATDLSVGTQIVHKTMADPDAVTAGKSLG